MIVHFTTVHQSTDTRIRLKEVETLAKELGQPVALFVQDGKGSDENKSTGVKVVDLGHRTKTRLARMTSGSWRMWHAVRSAQPKVAHFHDPELIPVGLALKLSGIHIIYDVHEDVPRQILVKYWLPMALRRPISWAIEGLERVGAKFFDAIIAATPKIAERFQTPKTIVVQNFPILEEMDTPNPLPIAKRPPHFAYVGGVTAERGAKEMVQAIGLIDEDSDCRLHLAGTFHSAQFETELQQISGWSRVHFYGWADRSEVAQILNGVRAGLVVLHPTQRYPDAYPVKMFEYMSVGLPVIASDFPLWRKILDGAGCGLLVDPLDPDAIVYAMQWILNHPQEAETMGKRGRQMVKDKYNWDRESENLLALYDKLLPDLSEKSSE